MRRVCGFTLVEVLVAIALFAALAALAWGGLGAVLRTREALVAAQDDFARTVRAVGQLERDLRAAVARPVRGNYGEPLPGMQGDTDHVEFTRQGFANPQAEPRSNLERVVYALDAHKLQRGRYAVLDRAPGTAPSRTTLRDGVAIFRLRYFDAAGRWLDQWPPREPSQFDALPRAVEFRFELDGLGEVVRLVEVAGDGGLIAR